MVERKRIFRQAMVYQPAASAEQNGLEQEVDTDLLRWSSLLDFEDYARYAALSTMLRNLLVLSLVLVAYWHSCLSGCDWCRLANH